MTTIYRVEVRARGKEGSTLPWQRICLESFPQAPEDRPSLRPRLLFVLGLSGQWGSVTAKYVHWVPKKTEEMVTLWMEKAWNTSQTPVLTGDVF